MNHFTPTYFTILCIFLSFQSTIFVDGATYNIVWDQRYCSDTTRYPSTTYRLPHNSACSVCIDDTLTLSIINNQGEDHYENLYRVNTSQDMLNCNASSNLNNKNIAFRNTQTFSIGNTGSESALFFTESSPPTKYYFISTSNGTESSARNDQFATPGNCLQLAFQVLPPNNGNCGTYGQDCSFTSILTSASSPIGCSISGTVTVPTSTSTSSVNPMGTSTSIPTSTSVLTTTSPTSTVTTEQPTTSTHDITSTSPITTTNRGVVVATSVENISAIIGWGFLLGVVISAIIFGTPCGIMFLILYWCGKISFPCDKRSYFPNKVTGENVEMTPTPTQSIQAKFSKEHEPSESPYENLS